MPHVELIPLDAIPTHLSGRAGSALAGELAEKLREALRKNQALLIRLSENERPASVSRLLRAAADTLGVVVRVTGDAFRERVNRSGRKGTEASVLYCRITKAAGKPVPAPALPRPITIPPARFEKTVLPGVEVSR